MMKAQRRHRNGRGLRATAAVGLNYNELRLKNKVSPAQRLADRGLKSIVGDGIGEGEGAICGKIPAPGARVEVLGPADVTA